MNIKIEIKCNKCNCSFELDANSFVDRDTLACPNCSTPYPQEIYNHLRAGILEFSQIPDAVGETDDLLLNRNGFTNTVKTYIF